MFESQYQLNERGRERDRELQQQRARELKQQQ